MSYSLYSTKIARKDINEGEYLRALIQISTDLEAIFFDKLFFEKKINSDLIENWTLGRLTNWVFKHNLIDSKHEELIKEFTKIRNAIVHTRYGIHNTTKDLNKLNYLAPLMLKICNFIDNTSVSRDFNLEIEKKYQEILEKTKNKYEKAFNKKF